ncbi:cytochrome c oxidase accessory protein CcoG [Pyruvatibacter sp.]|uniref:cytochrome c oxidase accessory protein CcoG n=1 Tax=Pyruvatibacter sp. TaxID=1981328 RepID=UPI0032ECE1DF
MTSNDPGSGLSDLAREAVANVVAPEPPPAAATGPGDGRAHEKVERHDVEPVNSAASRSLYEKRRAIHPKLVHGVFRNIKWVVMAVTLGIYYVLPWIRWDRGPNAPDQAVLLDMPGRRFYFFFIEIWPQEIYYITGLLVLASLVLFLATSLFGRVWCGYTCPQTVWTDLFIMVERMVEGDRNDRLRMAKRPWTLGKFGKKLTKHSIWVLIALATGGAWVFYFADAPTLAVQLVTLDAPVVAYLFIGVFASTTYLLGGLAREQVCTYMCPWPRIQGALVDDQSFLVSYRTDRGEPRGAHRKGDTWEGRGDCIDCKQCVVACPMGIDIRDGDQLECIQCALCIDACNDIMDKIDRPRGLITYDNFDNMERREKGLAPRTRLLRPRTILYAALIVLVGAIMLAALVTRSPLDVNVLRDRNPLFVMLSDGSIRNGYDVKILNKLSEERLFNVTVTGLEGARLSTLTQTGLETLPVAVAPDRLRNLRVFVSVSAEQTGLVEDGVADIDFVITDMMDGREVRNATTFRVPDQR